MLTSGVGKIEDFILKQIKEERYVLTTHARIRMNERLLTDSDIVSVAKTATSITRQEDNDTFLLTGNSAWEERVSLSVAVRKDIIIVTIFYKDSL